MTKSLDRYPRAEVNGLSSLSMSFFNFIIVSLILSILLLNFKLVTVVGAALKPIHILLIITTVYSVFFTRMAVKDLLIGFSFLVLPIFPLYRIGNVGEWFKSYVIYFIACCFMMTSLRSFLKVFKQNRDRYIKLFLYTIAFAQILGIIQFICMNFLGIFFLRDFWGAFQFHRNQFGTSGGFYRAYSVFLEPSFFAWVNNSALAILLYSSERLLSKKVSFVLAILSVFSIICTFSASGLVITMILFIAYGLFRSNNPAKLLAALFVLGLIFLTIGTFTDLFTPLKRIFVEIQTEGTSGYERLVTPLLYLKAVWTHYPFFGRGLGQDGILDAVGVIGRYEGVQNSLFGIFVWMGLSALSIMIPACIYSVRCVKRDRKWMLLLINILGIYVSTGAWCSVDTFLFLILLVAMGQGGLSENNVITKTKEA